MFDAKDELGAAEPAATIQAWMQKAGAHAVVLDYLARMLVDDADSPARLYTRGLYTDSRPLDAIGDSTGESEVAL